MSEEELVPVDLGNDYYLGDYFSTDAPRKDYLVPRITLERWEAAKAAYEAMQAEIDKVMGEQRERIREINSHRPKSPMASLIEEIYAKRMTFALQVPPLLRGPTYKEPE